MAGSAREITRELDRRDRERNRERRAALKKVMRALGEAERADTAGAEEIAELRTRCRQDVAAVRAGAQEARAEAGREVAAALEWFSEAELAQYTGVPHRQVGALLRLARSGSDGGVRRGRDAGDADRAEEDRPGGPEVVRPVAADTVGAQTSGGRIARGAATTGAGGGGER